AQILNREFVLSYLSASERQLRRVVANREAGLVTGPPTEIDAISSDELREVAAILAQAVEREEGAQPDAGPPAQLGDEPPPPKDDYAYIPREPLLGLVQSALEAYASAHLVAEEQPMLDDRRAGPTPVVTDQRLAGVDLQLTADGCRLWRRIEVANPR